MTLDPGASVNLKIPRLAQDDLRMQLEFDGNHVSRRSELGEWVLRSDEINSGLLKFATPGIPIRLAASTPNAAPVTYEAMPTSSYSGDKTWRELTSDLSVEPGVWRWPPHYNDLVLHQGSNNVQVDVISVGPPLVGETVRLIALPPLGFKVTRSNAMSGLWWWFLWPIFIAGQSIWAIVLVVRRRKRSQTLRSPS